ncbi:hypothetical protein BCR37DRAFT_393592 [Protomyces lactucae-debilis]|uniref:Uncharacterized protein n=1 Tax=Protomyces lactucae-debilis TaxID=2754530 RepID=A0A1Y2FAK6_PROLT|nr:uncharacterized protein BCR37DRAFT_393592 [Protomyces lactucae-debilis]ORY80948.1 hypothetical protein BCR37DRAFT_393592 [Protomyces lactucae-debilis]
MDDSIIDNLLDECSQLRVLIVGASRGKAQLIREVFGVHRITRYPPDFSRDEEIYSKENDLFIAHVFDSFEGVDAVLERRKRGEPDEVIHAIWHYIDAQDAVELVSGSSELACPAAVRKSGIPVLTIFGRFDNIVTRSEAIGALRRQGKPLSDGDKADAVHIRSITEAIQLYLMQYPKTTIITSKLPGSKLKLVDVMLAQLKSTQAKMLFISAQRLSASLKLDTSLSIAMKQFLVATISSAVPIPIPFAGYATTTAVTENIKADIVKVWNLHDPEILLTGTHDNTTMMDTITAIPVETAKMLVFMIPGLSQIKGVLSLPKLARTLGGLMIDLALIMERLFLATQLGADIGELLATPARLQAALPAKLELLNGERPFSPEVLRARREFMSPPISRPGTPSRVAPVAVDARPTPPPKPPRPGFAVATPPAKPPRPSPLDACVTTPPAKPPRPGQNSPAMRTPVARQPVITATPLKELTKDTLVQPAASAVTRELLDSVVRGYEPTKQLVAAELETFFDFEEGGLTKSFKKDTVQRKLSEIVQRHRLSEAFS